MDPPPLHDATPEPDARPDSKFGKPPHSKPRGWWVKWIPIAANILYVGWITEGVISAATQPDSRVDPLGVAFAIWLWFWGNVALCVPCVVLWMILRARDPYRGFTIPVLRDGTWWRYDKKLTPYWYDASTERWTQHADWAGRAEDRSEQGPVPWTSIVRLGASIMVALMIYNTADDLHPDDYVTDCYRYRYFTVSERCAGDPRIREFQLGAAFNALAGATTAYLFYTLLFRPYRPQPEHDVSLDT